MFSLLKFYYWLALKSFWLVLEVEIVSFAYLPSDPTANQLGLSCPSERIHMLITSLMVLNTNVYDQIINNNSLVKMQVTLCSTYCVSLFAQILLHDFGMSVGIYCVYLFAQFCYVCRYIHCVSLFAHILLHDFGG
jgi:hypothetical protein